MSLPLSNIEITYWALLYPELGTADLESVLLRI